MMNKEIMSIFNIARKSNIKKFINLHMLNQITLLKNMTLGESQDIYFENLYHSGPLSGNQLKEIGHSEILFNLGIDHPEENSLEAIASYCNSTLISTDLNVPYILRLEKKHGVIVISNKLPVSEQRYYSMLALCEWISFSSKAKINIQDNKVIKIGKSDIASSYYIKTASYTRRKEALRLLIPRDEFCYDIKKLKPTQNEINILAEKYHLNNYLCTLAVVFNTKMKMIMFCVDSTNPNDLWYQQSSALKISSELKIKESFKKNQHKFNAFDYLERLVRIKIFSGSKYGKNLFEYEGKTVFLYFEE